MLRGMKTMLKEMGQAQLRWFDGSEVLLQPPTSPAGYHLFISHVWKYAQDTAGTLKSTLRSLVPSLVAFLDVDDLEDLSRLEEYVRKSDVVLVLLTDKYLSSRNCRRELTEAVRLAKPLVVLLETDVDKGATSPVRLRAELDVLEADGSLPKEQRAACLQLIAHVEAAQAMHVAVRSHGSHSAPRPRCTQH